VSAYLLILYTKYYVYVRGHHRIHRTDTVGEESIHTPGFLLIPFYYIEQIYINDAFIKKYLLVKSKYNVKNIIT
jgi:hypothetical protein